MPCTRETAIISSTKAGEVIIVDEFTGRLMLGRRYSEGLHQAIEAKEGVKVQRESLTYATITIQNYFRMYAKLAGMTGTAVTEAEEFHKIYKLDVVVIPTNKPMVREDYQDRIYRDENAKFNAVVREIEEVHKNGQPVLVGTVSIEKSERLGELLRKKGISARILKCQPSPSYTGSRNHRRCRKTGGGHHRHQHGRPRRGYCPGRQRARRAGERFRQTLSKAGLGKSPPGLAGKT